MPRNKRLHFKDVNTLKFFAFLPIFVYCVFFLSNTEDDGIHNELTQLFQLLTRNSLDFFFFLAAFLLTSQSLREYKYTNKFSLKNFLVRRILRILPLFIIGLLFTFLVHPWILSALKLNEIIPPSGSSYIFLIPNYLGEFTREQYVYLCIIWTIYMFIQFYIFWGIVLKSLINKLLYVCFAVIAIGVLARIIHVSSDTISHFGFVFDTLSYGVPIGIGGILALFIRNEHTIIEKVKNVSKTRNIFIYIIGGLFVLFAYLISFNSAMVSFIPIVTCIFYSYIIIEQTFGKSSFIKFRTLKLFTHLGKISYGLIMYQAIVNVLCIIGIDSLDFDLSSMTVKISFFIVSFTISWILADLSYNIIEKPLLRFRREFKSV